MMDRYGRSQLLLSQRRYDMAERELRGLLSEDPRDATALSLLSLCILHDQDRMTEATQAAEQAVGFEPDEPLGYYALAVSNLRRNRFDAAEAAIEESLRLHPHDADAFDVLARARLGSGRFEGTLEAANQGLSIDPEHIDCGNMRSIALERLGRVDEAVQVANDTIRRDPDNSMSHATRGFTLKNSGNYQEAQVAFREALRLDPHNEMARMGLIEAMNNRSFVFRLVHRFYVGMSRLNSKAAFFLIFGAWILIQVLGRIADGVPALQPLIIPILILYALFVVLTWIANPLFNTFLRFHPFGQHLLDRRQRWASNLIAPCLALSLFSIIYGIWIGYWELGLIMGAYWVAMAIPISATFAMSTPRRRIILGVATIVVGCLPVVGLIRSTMAGDSFALFESLRLFAYSLLAVQIGSSVIAARPAQA